MKKVIAIDLDGVLAHYKDWKGVDHFGDPIPGAKEFVRELANKYDILVYTTRCCEEINKPEKSNLLVNRVRRWLNEHGFIFHDIWAGQGKPIAFAYIDDRAISCKPQDDGRCAFNKALEEVRKLVELE